MTSSARAIDTAHPPQVLLKVVNPALRLLLRTPAGAALKDFMVVRFTGRKTGRRYAVPVSAHHLDGDLLVILVAGWKHNFREGAAVDVTYAGQTAAMHGELIAEPGAVAESAHRVAVGLGAKKAQRSMGLAFPDDIVPSVEEFADASRRLGLAVIRLTPAT